MFEIDMILKELVARGGSDLHLKIGRPPLFRIAGDLVPTEFKPVSAGDMEQALQKVMSAEVYENLKAKKEADDSYELPGYARFRANAFQQMKKLGLVMRKIPYTIPSIDSLHLPSVLKDITNSSQGMVLVTGATGSGKSTTLAAMIEHLNRNSPLHIITIEDPIEFVYEDQMCTINQRQLGVDTGSLKESMRRALRQDPDVILLGEVRDHETLEFGIHAAETGHLLFSTLHTNDAKQTLDRIVDMFPVDSAAQIRHMLSLTLRAVISQRLVKRADGQGMTAILEIMINSGQIKDMIAEGKTSDLDKAIANAGSYYRMQTFNQALAKAVQDNIITQETALEASSNPSDLQLLLRGIQTGRITKEYAAEQEKSSPQIRSVFKKVAVPKMPEAASSPPTPGNPPPGPAKENKAKIIRGYKF